MDTTPTLYPPVPLILEGKHVILKPVEASYVKDFKEAVADGELWKLWYTLVPAPERIDEWIQKCIAEQQQGVSVPFAVVRKSDGKIVGTTRYMRIEKTIRRLEIGHTWYAASVQRTALNTECKYLLLTHAFEKLECVAVEFRTHRMNVRSRAAIERLGAQLDGILRNHGLMLNGTLRDTAVYSILNTEWPMVKKHLEYKLGR